MKRLVKRTSKRLRACENGDLAGRSAAYEGDRADNRSGRPWNRSVTLRHHPSVWLAPAGLLLLALLPWPYGYYNFLRLVVCAVAAWIAYTQWREDDALSGWVVALAATAILYNPVLPIFLTREIWSVLNLLSAGVFIGHFLALRRLVQARSVDGVRNSLTRGSSHALEPDRHSRPVASDDSQQR